jgi:DNA-binding NarL/FixJ family response regulator
MEAITEFANFLSERDHSHQEVLNHLSRVELKTFEVDSLLFFQSDDAGHFSIEGMSGVDSDTATELRTTYSMNDTWPAAYVIRNGLLLWLDGKSNDEKYSEVVRHFPLLIGPRILIVFPVFNDGVPTGALALTSRATKERTRDSELYLAAISSIFSMHLYRNVLVAPDTRVDTMKRNSALKTKPDSMSNEPTQRQLVIMRLISESRTNKNISENLGYSESTIRQEIMRIFETTGSSNRTQVAEFYRNYSNKIAENSQV